MNEPKSVRYQRLKRRAHLAHASIGIGWLAVLAFSPVSGRLADLAWAVTRGVPLHPVAGALVFLLLVVGGWELLSLPLVMYFGRHVEVRFGRVQQSVGAIVAGQWRAAWIGVGAIVIFSAILALAVESFGQLWWLGAGALSAAALAIALHFISMLLVRLARTRAVGRRTLLSGLREIARRSGVPLSDILEWQVEEGAPATALIAGLGRRRRVLIASEVLRDWSDDEIAVVVAHELAHHVHRDVWTTLTVEALVLSVGFWMAGAFAVAAPGVLTRGGPSGLTILPLVALVVVGVWLAATPLRLAQSRAQERRADRFALELTGEAGAFVAAVRRLGARHLAEEQPSRLARWLFYRHPPVTERIEDAERFARFRTAATPR